MEERSNGRREEERDQQRTDRQTEGGKLWREKTNVI